MTVGMDKDGTGSCISGSVLAEIIRADSVCCFPKSSALVSAVTLPAKTNWVDTCCSLQNSSISECDVPAGK